jgi:hypothetical protein
MKAHDHYREAALKLLPWICASCARRTSDT